MLIAQGNVKTLEGKPWAAVELISEVRVEEIVRHTIKWCRTKLKGQAFQILFPVKSCDLAGVRMLSPYLLIRAGRLESLKSVKSVMGVVGLITDIDGKIIRWEDGPAQDVIKRARAAHAGWSAGIRKGSFVRIIRGQHRMLCGKVKKIVDGQAEVVVSLRLRNVIVKIPVKALLNLGGETKEYFYVG